MDALEHQINRLARQVEHDRARLVEHASKVARMIDSARDVGDDDLLQYALARLRPACVKAMRSAGFTWQEIGSTFGVSVSMARKIVARRR